MRTNSLKTARDPAACSVRKGGLFSVTFTRKSFLQNIQDEKKQMIIFKINLGWCFSLPFPVFPTQLNMPICGKGYLSCCWFNLMSYNNFPEKWPNYSNTFIKRAEEMFWALLQVIIYQMIITKEKSKTRFVYILQKRVMWGIEIHEPKPWLIFHVCMEYLCSICVTFLLGFSFDQMNTCTCIFWLT